MKVPSVRRVIRRKTVDGKTVQKIKGAGFWGRFFGYLFHGLFLFGKVVVMSLVDVGICLFVSCLCLPVSIVCVSSLCSVGFESTLGDVIFILGFPSAFILVMWVVFTVWLLRLVNGWVRTLFDKIAVIGGTKRPEDVK